MAPSPPPQDPGDLATRARACGERLASALERLLQEAGCGELGTQATADRLGVSAVLASRTRRGFLAADPIETLRRVPGAKPLERVIAAARGLGATEECAHEARAAMEAFEGLVREEAGSRRTFDSMLADLGVNRPSFEAQRRQEIVKAYTEIEGLSIDTLYFTLLVAPSADGESIDILVQFGAFGLERLRPGSPFSFHRNRALCAVELDVPEDLDGEALLLEQFCSSPAPMEAIALPDGNGYRYQLGDTETGRRGRVDLVIEEINRKALPRERAPERGPMAYHFTTAYPVRQQVFEVRIHESLIPPCSAGLFQYHGIGNGPARLGDPFRDGDLRAPAGSLAIQPDGLALTEGSPVPRHAELLDHAYRRLGCGPEGFHTFSDRVAFPLPWLQTVIGWLEERDRPLPVPGS